MYLRLGKCRGLGEIRVAREGEAGGRIEDGRRIECRQAARGEARDDGVADALGGEQAGDPGWQVQQAVAQAHDAAEVDEACGVLEIEPGNALLLQDGIEHRVGHAEIIVHRGEHDHRRVGPRRAGNEMAAHGGVIERQHARLVAQHGLQRGKRLDRRMALLEAGEIVPGGGIRHLAHQRAEHGIGLVKAMVDKLRRKEHGIPQREPAGGKQLPDERKLPERMLLPVPRPCRQD